MLSATLRRIAVPATLVAALAVGAPAALASHGGGGGGGSGGGGGGGGGTAPAPPPPATPVSAAVSPAAIAFGPQAVGTTSAPQVLTLRNTGSGSLFINSVSTAGASPLDFNRTDDQCVGSAVAPGASCTITVVFTPSATGPRSVGLSIVDNATGSPQVVPLSGTGTSVTGPTPLSVDTTGETCTAGVCTLGFPGDDLVRNFFYASFGVLGQSTAPYSWSVSAGALPPGLALQPNGQLFGTPTATGTSTFTVRVADATGKTATQAFSVVISPQPPPLTNAQKSCQHAPGTTTATLTGPAIGGATPGGQGVGDQSQLTACGGFTVVRASVKNVNLPNGTVLWITLGGDPIGRVTLTGGAATMQPYTLPTSTLRKQSVLVYTTPPTGDLVQQPILSGPFL